MPALATSVFFSIVTAWPRRIEWPDRTRRDCLCSRNWLESGRRAVGALSNAHPVRPSRRPPAAASRGIQKGILAGCGGWRNACIARRTHSSERAPGAPPAIRLPTSHIASTGVSGPIRISDSHRRTSQIQFTPGQSAWKLTLSPGRPR